MSSSLRSQGKNTIVWILMGLLILGLGGFGVSNFSGSVRSIGSVGETEIDVNDYARALRSELNAASAQLGQRIGMTEARTFGIDQTVQARLFAAAALDEQARKMGISVGDGEVRHQILETKAFAGLDGKFDRETYKLALRQQGLTEAEYEAKLRAESARMIVQGAIAGGVPAPAPMVNRFTAYLTETRAISYAEITTTDLTAPLPTPDDAALRAFHTDHADEFTRPETREISYAWLSPEMLLDKVQLDEDALHAAYEARLSEFVTPERRLVEELVYPTTEEAAAAKARLDAGEASFADLAAERGLTLADIDKGEATKASLGAAGEAVFALEEPGVVGPVDSDLGPALYAMNAILEAQEVTFEDAREELSSEAALDQARRMIVDQSTGFDDLLAGGATLEDMAKETPMELGHIAFTANSQDGIAAYEAFRAAAATVTQDDFPTLASLDDGGVFALRLDAIKAPELIPYDEVKDRVADAWKTAQTHQMLLAKAAEMVARINDGATLSSQGLLTTAVGKLPRGGFIEDAPSDLSQVAFTLEPGKAAVVDADDQVMVVSLDAIHPANPIEPDVLAVHDAVERQLSQSISQDLYELYARAAEIEAGVTLNTAAINAVQAQLQ
ncbi:SurA N-terminal domain-containing protein [Phaeovulum sp.]|uniref:peptidylprolyl isomerase n=1 Tax=Phaeovulum sp. TaxID=2934796 RepID=UPI0039E4796A